MKYQLLKFCYAVEIVAYLAYVGHHKATKCPAVKMIARDELKHMVHIKRILAEAGKKPSVLFNLAFLTIGHLVRLTCSVSPEVLLDKVASIMEVFNIVSYNYMAEKFPLYASRFEDMACQEAAHQMFFEDKRALT